MCSMLQLTITISAALAPSCANDELIPITPVDVINKIVNWSDSSKGEALKFTECHASEKHGGLELR